MYDEIEICKKIHLLPGMVLNLNHKGFSEEVTVIRTYPRFVLCESYAGYRFTVAKSDLFYNKEVEW